MYENRITAFLDILGFGSLVEESAGDVELQKSISQALKSISPETMLKEDYSTINESQIPESELEQATRLNEQFVTACKMNMDIRVSYFSDCLVISAPNKEESISMLFHLIAKLSVRIWEDFSLSIRGGVNAGKLYHKEGEQIFGPALNCAYHIESKVAKTPRILFDQKLHPFKQHFEGNPIVRSLIAEKDSESYISLGSSYLYLMQDSTEYLPSFREDAYETQYQKVLTSPSTVQKLIESHHDNENIKTKYSWLKSDLENHLQQINPSWEHRSSKPL